ncbi:hypothetical protein LR013_05805 [candidate division NPL-UPA2 bacterium]|nr:hypothetical protein [candidate division NPL-UPA2 bacterium]
MSARHRTKTIVIPSYWGGMDKFPALSEKIVFDHPTRLNEDGTLPRLLDSFEILSDKDFKIVIIAVTNTPEIVDEVINKVERLIAPYRLRYDISLLHDKNLSRLGKMFSDSGVSESACKLVNLKNYAAVRNMCSLSGILTDSDITVFIDDDEVFTDKEFLKKAEEFVGKEYKGNPVRAVAGYYLQPETYRLDESKVPAWRRPYWNNISSMNQTFELFLGRPPRLKPTPFVFGGNMVLERETMMKVPFDPNITRGEDIDFLVNIRINGITFWLDRELSIKHLPPQILRPAWKGLREDIRRFLYERKKLMDHQDIREMSKDDFMPYPGIFLGSDLEERIIKTNELLRKEYERQSLDKDAHECDVNIELARNNPFENIDTRVWVRELTKSWQELTSAARGRGMPV